MNLPTREQCFKLLKKYGFKGPEEGGSSHYLIVNRISVFLAEKLKEKGVNVNIKLVDKASLLHDIDKSCIKNDFEHGELGYKILIKEGYPEAAEVVRRHTIMSLLNFKDFSWESKIVNYSDCRVRHNDIVSVEERIKDLKKRYIHLDPSNLDKAKPVILRIEKEIFGKIGMKQEDINNLTM